MQLRLGTYYFPVNGTMVKTARRPVRGNDGVVYQFVDTVSVEGWLEGAGPAALSVAMNLLTLALATPFRDLVLQTDAGAATATALYTATSVTGCVCVSGPDFPEWAGPEYVTQRRFAFAVEADYTAPGISPARIIDYQETVDVSGGGPLYVVLPALYGPPQRQLVYEQTPCVATQAGYAVGYAAYPLPPQPVWAFALRTPTPRVKRTSARKKGLARYREYRIDWNWDFEWTAPLVGVPNVQPPG